MFNTYRRGVDRDRRHRDHVDMLVTGGILESMDFSRVIGDVSLELGLQLKDKQVEAIQKFCEGSDVFVSLPTGFGKSMIYGLLPLVFDRAKGKYNRTHLLNRYCSSANVGIKGSIVVCVSPLIAIMKEQATRFARLGLSAEFVGEAQTSPDVKSKVLKGEIQLVFVSPENLLCNPAYRNMLLTDHYKDLLVGVAVDEAHCVKTW